MHYLLHFVFCERMVKFFITLKRRVKGEVIEKKVVCVILTKGDANFMLTKHFQFRRHALCLFFRLPRLQKFYFNFELYAEHHQSFLQGKLFVCEEEKIMGPELTRG